jgi:hypothetical protein
MQLSFGDGRSSRGPAPDFDPHAHRDQLCAVIREIESAVLAAPNEAQTLCPTPRCIAC